MNRHLFGVNWLPAQIQTVNPIFILILLPLFSYVIYPAVATVCEGDAAPAVWRRACGRRPARS